MLEALFERVHPDVLPLPERLLDVFLPDTKENKKEGETIYFSQRSQSSCGAFSLLLLKKLCILTELSILFWLKFVLHEGQFPPQVDKGSNVSLQLIGK